MLALTSLVFASLIALANAHFQLQVPAPRGNFVEDNEPNFCDGYNDAASNRTEFPMTGGYFVLNSEHVSWTSASFFPSSPPIDILTTRLQVGVNLSTSQNPQQFQDFSVPVFPFASESGEGPACFPLDLSSAGLTNGQNITLEFVFDGSDGILYQCADLTVSTTATLPSDSTCNFTTGTSASGAATSTAPAGSSSATTSSPPSAAVALSVPGTYLALLVGLVGAAAGAFIV
ncbi:hypothetical protein MSAN_02181500 [Mycena sanguinolenta]|uniref:Copper acquisition factor BIM1-like domain-containing protein n=1 Tax=Mycena sanguinolenta TaxID=230812 RepID=A0A8H6XFX9_9AGAR|nr:hypothetical protein MSAN_02181500 [Mycena sanguinolenta]